ncbi:MAG: hypothetical protein ACFFBD_12465 [Candidatus Hodarchaeota archaeon]
MTYWRLYMLEESRKRRSPALRGQKQLFPLGAEIHDSTGEITR